ncbi:MAG: PD40 domain-containing protein [Ignavibacteriales bacterium]|nr:PD40 domain-containing protein [Ignavibacteriales bacterium]
MNLLKTSGKVKNEGLESVDGGKYTPLMGSSWRVLVLIAGLVSLRVAGCQTVIGPDPTVEESYLHVRPAWSPDGASIAFTGSTPFPQGIYRVDTAGGSPVLLKSGEGIGVTWSPDSRWIAYSAFLRIYKMTSDGDSATLVAQTANDIRPSWSPDGGRIVYVNNGLKTVGVQTGTIVSLIPYGDFPSWKGADEIVFLAGLIPGRHEFQLYRLTTQDTEFIYRFSSVQEVRFTSINAAGTSLVFAAQRFDRTDYSQIYVFSLLDSSTVRLTVDAGDHPAWSPDGSHIVYTRPVAGDGGLWIMRADGSQKRRLTQP